MIKTKQKIHTIVITLLSSLLLACVGDNNDLVQFMNETKARKARPIEPIPKFAPLAFFTFPAHDNRRNPFKPIEEKKRIEEFAPDQNRKKEPLESFPLDALKFVGTLNEGFKVWALILQPDKQVVRIRVGEYMGQNYGRVQVIQNDLIKIEESIKNSGTWEKIVTKINLNTGK